MSFRDVDAMLQCLFYVNDLPGGEAHHDGGMKGAIRGRCSRTAAALTAEETRALDALRASRSARSSRRARPARARRT
jgi:hypothetical protein